MPKNYLEEKNKLIDYLKNIPGINLLGESEKTEYENFVDSKFAASLKVDCVINSYGVYYTSNIGSIFNELKSSSEYQEYTLDNICNAFLGKYSRDILEIVSERVSIFRYLNEELKQKFIKKIVINYIKSLHSNIPNADSKNQIGIKSFKSFFRDFDPEELLLKLIIDSSNPISEIFFNENIKYLEKKFIICIPASKLISEEKRKNIIKFITPHFIKFAITNEIEPNVDNFELWINQVHIPSQDPIQSFTDLQNYVFDAINKESIQYISEEIFSGMRCAVLLTDAERELLSETLVKFFIKHIIENKVRVDDLSSVVRNYIQNILSEFYSPNKKQKGATLDADLKNILNESQDLLYKKGLQTLKVIFSYFFLNHPSDAEVKKLFYVFDVGISDDEKILALSKYFKSVHKENQILIENKYNLELEKVQEGWLLAAARWLLGNQKVQQFGASQALLSKFGLLHQGNGGLATEAGNLILIADNAHIAGNVRKLFQSICLPLKPLAKEWFVLLPSETNWLMIGWRLLVPILIASVVIALGFLLISSIVSMPAVFELLMIVPLAYFGFFAASISLVGRDYVYEKTMNYLYNGMYNRPEYKVNNALITTFGEDLATIIRNYYVAEFQECDFWLKELENRTEKKIVSSDNERDYLLVNSGARKEELLAEWSKLTMFRVINPSSKEELWDLIKRRVKIDSITQYDINQNERLTHIQSYVKSISTNKHHLFFQDNFKKETSIIRSKHEYEKLQSLKEINYKLQDKLKDNLSMV